MHAHDGQRASMWWSRHGTTSANGRQASSSRVGPTPRLFEQRAHSTVHTSHRPLPRVHRRRRCIPRADRRDGRAPRGWHPVC